MKGYFGMQKSPYPSTDLFSQKDRVTGGYCKWIFELEIPDGAKIGARFFVVVAMYGDTPVPSTQGYPSESEAESACAEWSAETAADPNWQLFITEMEVVDPDEAAAAAEAAWDRLKQEGWKSPPKENDEAEGESH